GILLRNGVCVTDDHHLTRGHLHCLVPGSRPVEDLMTGVSHKEFEVREPCLQSGGNVPESLFPRSRIIVHIGHCNRNISNTRPPSACSNDNNTRSCILPNLRSAHPS